MEPKSQQTLDAELIALAALAHNEAIIMAGDNRQREIEGYGPAWASGCGYLPATTALFDEMVKRGYKI